MLNASVLAPSFFLGASAQMGMPLPLRLKVAVPKPQTPIRVEWLHRRGVRTKAKKRQDRKSRPLKPETSQNHPKNARSTQGHTRLKLGPAGTPEASPWLRAGLIGSGFKV